MIHVDLTGARPFFTAAGPDFKLAALAHETLASGTGLGADFTGWLTLPQHIKDTELDRIVAAAEKIRAPRPWSSSASAAPIWAPAAPSSF